MPGWKDSIAETSYGFLAGGMNGIARFDGNGFRYLPFEDENHVRGISGLVESEDGDLWLNGAYGVLRVPASEISAALASPTHRMKSEIITEGNVIGPAPMIYAMPSAVSGARGSVWFTSSNTAVYIDPKNFPRNPVPPDLTISSVTVDGRILSDYRRIEAGANTLIIKYAGVNLTAPERVIYRYRLEGSDNTWQEVGGRTEAVYTRLRPGKYTFHVLASNGEGGWSEASTAQFVVLPYFYETLWFAILCVALIVVVIWLTLTLRLRRVSEKMRIRAEERANERVRIARDLHDTLLQGVQGLMLRFHVVAQEVPEGGATRERLERALKSADAVLLEGRDRVTNLRTNSLEGTTLAEAFVSVAAHFTHHSNTRFHVLTEGPPVTIEPLVLEEIFCIGREAIINAFHHANASNIEVTITYRKKAIGVSFGDDGSGIAEPILKAYRKEGHWGLVGMKERATKIGATLECQSSSATGTQVTLTVPGRLAYSHPSAIRAMLSGHLRLLRP